MFSIVKERKKKILAKKRCLTRKEPALPEESNHDGSSLRMGGRGILKKGGGSSGKMDLIRPQLTGGRRCS